MRKRRGEGVFPGLDGWAMIISIRFARRRASVPHRVATLARRKGRSFQTLSRMRGYAHVSQSALKMDRMVFRAVLQSRNDPWVELLGAGTATFSLGSVFRCRGGLLVLFATADSPSPTMRSQISWMCSRSQFAVADPAV